MSEKKTMQLGLIGLGRMGANMVRWLMKNGHECVVFDRSPDAVNDLVKERAIGAASLADFVKKLSRPRAVWLHGSGWSGGWLDWRTRTGRWNPVTS
jgi:6-phosphogluconate dehydrogenase (decarboxylating)